MSEEKKVVPEEIADTPDKEAPPDITGKKLPRKGKKKAIEGDDGRTIAEMNVEGMPWYRSPEEIEKHKKASKLRLSFKERLALIWAAYGAYLPRVLIFVLSYTIVALILYFFWLS